MSFEDCGLSLCTLVFWTTHEDYLCVSGRSSWCWCWCRWSHSVQRHRTTTTIQRTTSNHRERSTKTVVRAQRAGIFPPTGNEPSYQQPFVLCWERRTVVLQKNKKQTDTEYGWWKDRTGDCVLVLVFESGNGDGGCDSGSEGKVMEERREYWTRREGLPSITQLMCGIVSSVLDVHKVLMWMGLSGPGSTYVLAFFVLYFCFYDLNRRNLLF